MFCSKCGAQVADETAFCTNCGASMAATMSAGTDTGQAASVPPPVTPSPPQATTPMQPPQPPAMPPQPPDMPAQPPDMPPQPPDMPAQPPAMPGQSATYATPAPVAAGALYPKTPLGGRLLAVIVDSIIGTALLPLGILLVYAGMAREESSVAGFVLLGLGAVWQLAYTLGRDGVRGAGFGKRLAGLVVVSSASGAPAGMGASFVRQIVLYALNIVPVIGSLIEPILVLTDQSGRRLGDKAAKTQVVRAADATARGFAAPTKRGGAVLALALALLVSVAGFAVGGYAFYKAVNEVGDVVEVTIDTGTTTGGDGQDADGAQTAVPVTPEEPVGGETAVIPEETTDPSEEGGLNPEVATDAVGTLLVAMQNDDVEGMKAVATESFKAEYPEFFYGASGALADFEIIDVFQDAAIYVVVVDEDWISGPEQVMYFVTWENGRALVDGQAFE